MLVCDQPAKFFDPCSRGRQLPLKQTHRGCWHFNAMGHLSITECEPLLHHLLGDFEQIAIANGVRWADGCCPKIG